MQITLKKVEDLIPYENNARTHSPNQIQQIVNSISEFGFTNPILLDGKNGIIAGHGRLEAAKVLNLKEIPCIELDYLTEAQKKALIIADNKIALNAGWDEELLEAEIKELEQLDFDIDILGFEDLEVTDIKQFKQREEMISKCDLKETFKINKMETFNYFTFFNKTADGYQLDELKTEEFIPIFTQEFVTHIKGILSGNLNGWAILTTPKRQEFHFMTEVCKEISDELDLPFYENALIAQNKSRFEPKFKIDAKIKEKNIILLDDIITTGKTIQASRELLKDKNVICLIAIKNMGLAIAPTYIDFDSDIEKQISISDKEVTAKDIEEAENDNVLNNVKKYITFTCPNCLEDFQVKQENLEDFIKGRE
jgi:pyrimidine operon attenuation protein/uracil phosphoribosyltransferase